MDHRDAVAELARAAGTQFDPHVVAALLGRLADGTLAADGAASARRRADRYSRSGRRSTPCQQNSIARSTSTSRGTSWWSCHHRRQRLHSARQQLRVDLDLQLALGRVERAPALKSDAMRPADDRRGSTLDRADALRHVGVGRRGRAATPAVLLDEAQERLEARAQPALKDLAALGGRLQAAEDLGDARRAVRRAARAGREVLVDERLRDPRPMRDVVQRGAAVAAARERVLRGGEDDLAPLSGGIRRRRSAGAKWRPRSVVRTG